MKRAGNEATVLLGLRRAPASHRAPRAAAFNQRPTSISAERDWMAIVAGKQMRDIYENCRVLYVTSERPRTAASSAASSENRVGGCLGRG